MPITWDAAMDQRLLLAILQTSDVSINYPKVAELLTTPAQLCTKDAVNHRIRNIKKAIGAMGGTSSAGNTPSKKKNTTPRKRSAPAAKDSDSDENDEETNPKDKKQRKTPTRATKTKKEGHYAESDEENGNVTPVKVEEDAGTGATEDDEFGADGPPTPGGFDEEI